MYFTAHHSTTLAISALKKKLLHSSRLLDDGRALVNTAQQYTAHYRKTQHSNHFSAQQCTAQCYTAQHSTAQHSINQHCTILHNTAQKGQHCRTPHSTAQHDWLTLHSNSHHSTALHSAPQQGAEGEEREEKRDRKKDSNYTLKKKKIF